MARCCQRGTKTQCKPYLAEWRASFNQLFERKARIDNPDFDSMLYWNQILLDYQERKLEIKQYFEMIEDEPIPYDKASYGHWMRYNEHGMLPYQGSWIDQPQWVIDDFHYFNMLSEQHNIGYWIKQAKENLQSAAEKATSKRGK